MIKLLVGVSEDFDGRSVQKAVDHRISANAYMAVFSINGHICRRCVVVSSDVAANYFLLLFYFPCKFSVVLSAIIHATIGSASEARKIVSGVIYQTVIFELSFVLSLR